MTYFAFKVLLGLGTCMLNVCMFMYGKMMYMYVSSHMLHIEAFTQWVSPWFRNTYNSTCEGPVSKCKHVHVHMRTGKSTLFCLVSIIMGLFLDVTCYCHKLVSLIIGFYSLFLFMIKKWPRMCTQRGN